MQHLENKPFKIRASKASVFTVSPLGVSVGAKTAIKNIAIANMFGVTEEFGSKYTDKGILMEQAAIDMLNRNLFRNYTKNEQRFDNGRFNGTPDIVDSSGLLKAIRDEKCSWSAFTFPWTEEQAWKEVKKGGYDDQVRVYMMLTDADIGYIDFVLLSTPEELLRESEFDAHDFEHIPEPLRITTVEIKRESKWEADINKAWEAANEYYLELCEILKTKANK